MIASEIKGYEPKIVEYVNDYRKTLSDARSEREDVWVECMEAYLSKFNKAWVAEARKQNRSRRYLALTWDAVENNTAQLMEMLFPSNDWFTVEPRRIGGSILIDDRAAPRVTELLKWQHEMMGFDAQANDLIKWLVILGNVVWTQDWHVEKMVNYPAYAAAMQAWIAQQQAAMAEYQQLMQDYQIQVAIAQRSGLPPPPPPPVEEPEQPVGNLEIAYQGPRLRVGNIFNFVIDTEANDPSTAFRCTTFWRSKAYLKQYSEINEDGYAIYENLEQVRDSDRSTNQSSDRDRMIGDTFGVQIPKKDMVTLFEACGDFEVSLGTPLGEKKIYKNYIATIANEKTLIRFEPGYMWDSRPHQRLSGLIPCPGQVYHIGLVEMALGTQSAINAKQNQMIDAGAICINPEMKAIDDGIFNPVEARSGPGKIHVVGTMENIQPILRDLGGLQLSFSEIGAMKGEFQQITRSANPFTTQHYKKSATEIARDTSVSGGSLKRIAMFVEKNSIMPILDMQLRLNKQYMDENVVLRVTQDQKEQTWTVSPADVRHSWNVKVVGSLNAMIKDKRIDDLLMFFQLTTGNPVTVPYIDVRYLLKRILDELGVQDSDKILANDALARLQAAIMQAQMGGGGAAQNDQGGGSSSSGNGKQPGPGVSAGLSPSEEAVEPFLNKTALGGVAF